MRLVGGRRSSLPDYVMLLVGANAGLIGMAKEHLGIALALALPVFICVTKIDMTPAHVYESTIKQLTKVLKSPGCRKTPIFVENAHQAVEAAIRLGKDRVAPIFPISNVTGAGLDLVRLFLNTLPISGGHSQSFDASGESILGSLMNCPLRVFPLILFFPISFLTSLPGFFPHQLHSLSRYLTLSASLSLEQSSLELLLADK